MVLEITGQKKTVTVGELNSLFVKYTKEWGVLMSVQWQIPGKIVKNYEANFSEGKVTEVEEAEKKKFSINFYWVDGGDGRTVEATCQFMSQGAIITKKISATCDVKRPKMNKFHKELGTVQISDEKIPFSGENEWDSLGLYGDVTIIHGKKYLRAGIYWTANVSPNGASDGEIAFIQRINTLRVYLPSGEKWTSQGEFVLDGAEGKTKIYYGQKTVPLAGGKDATLKQNDSPSQALDSPSRPLSGFQQETEVTADDTFEIYLMYKSSQAQSIWVPLGALWWKWKGACKRGTKMDDAGTITDPWVVQPGADASAADTGYDTLAFPTWNDYFPDLG